NMAAAAQFVEGVKTNNPELMQVEFFGPEHVKQALEGKSNPELQALLAACNEWLKDPKPVISVGVWPTQSGGTMISRVLTAKGIKAEPKQPSLDDLRVAATNDFINAFKENGANVVALGAAFFGAHGSQQKNKLYDFLKPIADNTNDPDVSELSDWSKGGLEGCSAQELHTILKNLDLFS